MHPIHQYLFLVPKIYDIKIKFTSAFLNRSANESPGGKRPPQRASWSITIESKYFLKLLFISVFRYDYDVFAV